MLLAIDIGNTNIELGIFNLNDKEDFTLHENFRISTRRDYTTDDLWARVRSLIDDENGIYKKIKAAVISSVVPPLNHPTQKMMLKYFNLNSLCINFKSNTGLNYKYLNPSEIGADRIASSVAAEHLYGGPAIIMDFGTATTFDIIDNDKGYLGGCIIPGVKTSLEGLASRAAKLFPVEIVPLKRIIRKSTKSSMQSGIYHGTICMIQGMIEKIKRELNYNEVKIIATGGFSNLLASAISTIEIIDPFLVMKGLKILYHRNSV